MELRVIFAATMCSLCLSVEGKEFLNKFCPFTLEKCKTEPYNKLKTCQVALNEPEKLKALSDKFLCSSRDKMENQANVRDKRSLEASNHTRSRRSTCNLCTTREREEIIYVAYDAHDGTDRMVELLHDPGQLLYQTYFVHQCASLETNALGRPHKCGKHMITFKAVVFNDDYSVGVRHVSYPVACAFQYDC